MKSINIFLGLVTIFIGLPIGIIQTYILYSYVHAPQIVWVLWIINLPIGIMLQIFATVAKSTK